MIPAARRADWYARGVGGAAAREIKKIPAAVDPPMILLAKSSGAGWLCHEPHAGGLACGCKRLARKPCVEAAEIDRRCCEHGLQVRFSEPDVAGTAPVHGPHAL